MKTPSFKDGVNNDCIPLPGQICLPALYKVLPFGEDILGGAYLKKSISLYFGNNQSVSSTSNSSLSTW